LLLRKIKRCYLANVKNQTMIQSLLGSMKIDEIPKQIRQRLKDLARTLHGGQMGRELVVRAL